MNVSIYSENRRGILYVILVLDRVYNVTFTDYDLYSMSRRRMEYKS